MAKRVVEEYDLVVCGGGLAGFCAAVAAARHGARTCLVQDRPVFGGNSSSEVRVTPHGAAAYHAYARETGIISELLIEERAVNHEVILENGWTNSVWDLAMYDMAMRTPNLTFHLNTSIFDVEMNEDHTIHAVMGRVANAEVELILKARTFIDCTGDGVVADLAGCEWRMGSEGKDEFNEPHAPLQASKDTMGSSIHFKTKDMGRPVPYKAPEWAVQHEDASYFYDQGRTFYDLRGGYWWLEIGVPWDTIHEAEDIRYELTRHTLGVWDWIKNKDPLMKEKAANYALDWIGQVPGKRESRRVVGQYFMTEHDPVNKTVFADEVAYGGWFLDLHTPGGLLAPTSEPASAEGYSQTSDYAIKSYCGPYGIPLRIMIAKDVGNLMLAGRNVSVTHAALGTVRVMSTTALMGQAVGTAAAIGLKRNLQLSEIPEKSIVELQQTLLRDGCFLPNVRNADPLDLARSAKVTASSEAVVYGVGPESKGSVDSLQSWEERKSSDDALHNRRAQWIAIQTPTIERISVCLSNPTPDVQIVEAELLPTDHIWDYRAQSGEPIARAQLEVKPGAMQWIEWPINLYEHSGLKPGSYVRLDLLANSHVCWHTAGTIIPGHMSAFEMGKSRLRRYREGVTMSYRIEPAQPCFHADNVISGVTRPYQFTNLWVSDPRQPLAQWLELQWDEPQTIREIQITFPGHLLREYHYYPPFYKDPNCAKDYSICVWVNKQWKEVVRVEGNYQTRCRHLLAEPLQTGKLRIIIHATNGDPSAAIYEVRCYK